MSVPQDKMRLALNELVKTHQKVLTAINELRLQGYTLEATNLQIWSFAQQKQYRR